MPISSHCSYKSPVHFKSKLYTVLIDFWTYKMRVTWNLVKRCSAFGSRIVMTLGHHSDVKWAPCHYIDVIMNAMTSQITGLFAQPFVQTQIKENIKAPRHWPLWGESTGDPKKGPVTRKMFPFDVVIMLSQITENSTVCPTACSG